MLPTEKIYIGSEKVHPETAQTTTSRSQNHRNSLLQLQFSVTEVLRIQRASQLSDQFHLHVKRVYMVTSTTAELGVLLCAHQYVCGT